MIKWHDWLKMHEMSMSVNFHGDWEGLRKDVDSGKTQTSYGYTDIKGKPTQHVDNWPVDTVKYLTRPGSQEHIVQKYEKVPFDFNVYFVRKAGFTPFTNFSMKGEIAPDKLAQILPEGGYKIEPNKINIFFWHNMGADSMAMTPWMIAHRFGHAVEVLSGSHPLTKFTPVQDAEQIIKTAYQMQNYKKLASPDHQTTTITEAATRAFFLGVLTMASARSGKLRPDDSPREIFAQYVMQQNIPVKQPPQQLQAEALGYDDEEDYAYAKATFVLSDPEKANAMLGQVVTNWETILQQGLDACKGKIYAE